MIKKLKIIIFYDYKKIFKNGLINKHQLLYNNFLSWNNGWRLTKIQKAS